MTLLMNKWENIIMLVLGWTFQLIDPNGDQNTKNSQLSIQIDAQMVLNIRWYQFNTTLNIVTIVTNSICHAQWRL